MLSLAALLLVPAYSGGGGEGGSGQTCDAINLCNVNWDGATSASCPPGMTKVAPPERSDTYTLRTGDGADVGSDPTHYVPGELLPLYMRVVKRTIVGKGWCSQVLNVLDL